MSYTVHASPFPGFSMTSTVSEGSSVHLGTVPCDFTINGRTYRGTKVSLLRGVLHIDDKAIGEEETEADGSKIRWRTCNIQVEGNVTGGIRATSASITIKGNVEGAISTGSGDVEISGTHTGAIGTGSGDVGIGGTCNGNVGTGSGDVRIEGSCTGTPQTMSGKITVKGQPVAKSRAKH